MGVPPVAGGVVSFFVRRDLRRLAPSRERVQARGGPAQDPRGEGHQLLRGTPEVRHGLHQAEDFGADLYVGSPKLGRVGRFQCRCELPYSEF